MSPKRVARRIASTSTYILGGAVLAALAVRPVSEPPKLAERGIALWSMRMLDFADEDPMGVECGSIAGGGLVLPTGAPPTLACDAARTVVFQVRSNLAAAASPIEPAKFAEATADWLDPHGLWSVAPDAPVGPLLSRHAEQLLKEIEAPHPSGECSSAKIIGAALADWMKELRTAFVEGMQAGSSLTNSRADVWRIVNRGPFQDGPITRSGRGLARELGSDLAAIQAAYGTPLEPFVLAAKERFFPDLSADAWARVILASAVRAYVPQIDAHGAWAPLDEEVSIYDLDLETNPPIRLWSDMTRTALGVRIDRDAYAPLRDGDIVLSIRGTALAGMSVEQAEQSAVMADAPHGPPVLVKVLRADSPTPIELEVKLPVEIDKVADALPAATEHDLPLEWIRYGDGRAAVIAVHDVPDDLGERMGAVIASVRNARDARGVVLDVRANGGGSTDGDIAALGHFLPGATLFPMRRRDGGIEVERAPEIPSEQRWTGPLAVLVDGDSASAAEMIAGAIGSYRRGVVVGDRTYGKGCAQEYLDDEARAGVLRLTTLLFALPDGSPVQKVGVSPQITISLPSAPEREASLPRALAAWRGPDVRDAALVHNVPWHGHSGRVGPCQDEAICRSLRAIGAMAAASR